MCAHLYIHAQTRAHTYTEREIDTHRNSTSKLNRKALNNKKLEAV